LRENDDFLLRLKYNGDNEKIRHEIDKRIVEFFDSLRKMKQSRYLFIIPVMNLTIEEDIEIGGNSIVTLNAPLFASLESAYSMKFGIDRENYLNPVDELPKINETRTFAIIKTDAPDSEKALELALQKTETCLNILRLYGSDVPLS